MNDSLQDILFEGEEVLWEGRPRKNCYVLKNFGKLLPIALIWLVFDGFFIGTTIFTGAFKEMWPVLVVFFGIHLFPVWSCIGKLITCNLEHKNIVYAVTNRRIISRTGIVGVDFETVDYTDISNIRVDVSVIERFFNVGTLVISISAGKSVFFYSIDSPYDLYKKVNKIFVDMKTDVHYPNALRPEINPGYNTKYHE